MSGHHKFSQLTEQFSEERQAEIAQKTAQLQAEMELSEFLQLEEREKKILAISLDEDILEWFKNQGQGYQILINNVLRSYVNAQQKKTH
ncbi:BrnA antitoxin family protein [Crocosphaera sp. XPORK-15E]|uniref:BrnA antitoxin family protein n=1 Tax=Crocosphaera sp. XPORK-15E TaxID=3110247 RepID=UPI002B2131BE|nr:BrnA antitoxin family protein [Crocosphaera sp. XPORK-15E]MEA5534732.1 BrnA antitoxin family protein [Crocosphaera sp. XPORK-15E]